MSGVDTRNISRDSLFLMAEVRLEGEQSEHRVKVRNLSSGGMMAEGGPSVVRGGNVSIQLRNIGWVEGVIAWVQDERFGIAFAKEIEPKLARAPVGSAEKSSPRFTRPSGIYADQSADPARLRNI
ncbi:PilZ domain-containing protein [Pontixanthobacter sp. CEM42]|uniref:PilZ domain-containing protein n=1 Tax=Pontixanthobacter sp. CEM42 TaxID=2792077 RepID=UPI001AE0C3ED|nr:PilZ domain-containing protein [Pontixanthobacter sp. CEM42]